MKDTIIDNLELSGTGTSIKVGTIYKSLDDAIMSEANSGSKSNTVILKENGDKMFEKVGENTTLLHGLQIFLAKAFQLPEYTQCDTVDSVLGFNIPENQPIDQTGDNTKPYYDKIPNMLSPIAGASDEYMKSLYDMMARKIFGFMFHIDNSATTSVRSASRTEPGFTDKDIIPIRIFNDEDSIAARKQRRRTYAGRQVVTKSERSYTNYYIKKIQPEDIKLKTLDKNGSPLPIALSDTDISDTPMKAAITIRIRLSKEELKDYFRLYENTASTTRYDAISLVSGIEYGHNSGNQDTGFDFRDIKVTNRANLLTNRLGAEGDLSLVYAIYLK